MKYFCISLINCKLYPAKYKLRKLFNLSLNIKNLFFILLIILFSLELYGENNADTTSLNKRNIKLFIIEEIDRYPLIYPISDTWFSRSLMLRQSPYNSISVDFDGIVLNSIIDGNFRGDILQDYFTGYEINTCKSDIYNSSEDLSGSIKLTSKHIDSNRFSAIFQGGNIFGGSSLEYIGNSKYLNWSSKIDYLTSAGYDISSNKPDSIGLARQNSSYEKFSVNGGVGIGDNKSRIFANFVYSHSNQGFPISIIPNEKLFLKEPDFILNIYNLDFSNLIDKDYKIEGNIFYMRTKSVVEKYDNEQFLTQLNSSSFTKIFEESKFGWNSALNFKPDVIPPGTITLNYSRESLKYQSGKDMLKKRYEIERLVLGLKFAESSENWEYWIGGNYKILNPLSSFNDNIPSTISDFEYNILLGYKFSEYFSIYLSNQRNIMLPQIYQLYPDINQMSLSFGYIESTLNTNYEIKFASRLSVDNDIWLKYFNTYLESIAFPFSLVEYPIENIQNNLNSQGIDLGGNIRSRYLNISYGIQYQFEPTTFYEQFGREINYPEIIIKADFYKLYDFGFSWKIKTTLVSGRTSKFVENYNQNDFTLIDLRLSQIVIEQNELFISINNLTNTYYEIIRGMPMPGIYFVAGIKLVL